MSGSLESGTTNGRSSSILSLPLLNNTKVNNLKNRVLDNKQKLGIFEDGQYDVFGEYQLYKSTSPPPYNNDWRVAKISPDGKSVISVSIQVG